VENAATLRANFVIAPSHYLYRDRISFTLEPGTSSKLVDVELR